MEGVDVYSEPESAREYLLEGLHASRNYIGRFSHILAAVWGDESDKVIDFFGYQGIKNWPGNAGCVPWNVVNGSMNILIEHCCEDAQLMVADEIRYRRSCKSLEDFMANPPEGIVPVRKKIEPVTLTQHS